jgi:hypothetical protein
MTAGGAPREGDEQLMGLIKEATAAQDAVPDRVVEAAREAWTWRTVDAELVALLHDSTVDDDALAGVRGAGTVRALSFGVGDHMIEVEISEDGERRRLVGQVMPPPGPGERTIVVDRLDGGALELELDELGRFEADRLSAGLVRLRTTDVEGRVVTEWVAI